MVDRNSPSPVATSPPTRSAIKSPLSAAKDALAKTHQFHPTAEPTPITLDLPESTFQLEAPNGHTDSIPPIEGEAEEAESQSKESHSLEEAEGRVNGTVNGTDSNNDSPTGDDPIQSDAASPKPPDSPTDPKPTEKASDDLEAEPASTALASPPAASRQSSPSQPEEVPPSDQDTRPSDSTTAPPPTAEAPSAQGPTGEFYPFWDFFFLVSLLWFLFLLVQKYYVGSLWANLGLHCNFPSQNLKKKTSRLRQTRPSQHTQPIQIRQS